MMDFRLTDDQEALRDGVRAFCEARFAAKRLDETARAGGFDRALWTELAGMGVFGLRLPERNGGVGLGMALSMARPPLARKGIRMHSGCCLRIPESDA
jgi:alkylation response protein AidB-like acyl-CoA dehydrogenase